MCPLLERGRRDHSDISPSERSLHSQIISHAPASTLRISHWPHSWWLGCFTRFAGECTGGHAEHARSPRPEGAGWALPSACTPHYRQPCSVFLVHLSHAVLEGEASAGVGNGQKTRQGVLATASRSRHKWELCPRSGVSPSARQDDGWSSACTSLCQGSCQGSSWQHRTLRNERADVKRCCLRLIGKFGHPSDTR